MNTDNKFDKNSPNDGYAIKANHMLFVRSGSGNSNTWSAIGPASYDILLAIALNTTTEQEFIIALVVKHTENCF